MHNSFSRLTNVFIKALESLSQFISTHFVINSKLIQHYKGSSKIHETCI